VRIRLAIPDRLVTPQALEAALEATTLANEQAIIHGEVPELTDAIRHGVKWKPEPFTDGEHFDLAHQVAARKWGDCDDLAPWLAGQLRASGEDPDAVPRVYKTGKDRWHVVVQTGDGQILDPSKWAGMGKRSAPSSQGVSGMVAQPFARPDGGAMCVVPHRGKWWARCDVPWPDGSGHLASHARARTPEEALDRAVAGAIACGETIDSPLCDRARAVGSLLLGHPDEVGSLFGSLLKGAASFVPGGGAALQAAKMAKSGLSALSHGKGKAAPPGSETHPSGSVSVPLEQSDPGHGQHMMLYYHPAYAPGPVIARF
jgi:hypothetical protein